jgi:ankyrin repeat protein
MPTELPLRPHLDHLRREAKSLVRAARDHDAAALARLAEVPRLAALSPADLARHAQLADAQHAVATAYGFASWARLKHEVEARAPLARQLERLLAAIREHATDEAERLLVRHPQLAHAHFGVACALGEVEFVHRALAADPGAATRPCAAGPWPPLCFASASPFHARDTHTADAIARVVELLLAAGADANSSVSSSPDDAGPGLPVLYFACERGNAAVARVLLEHGADPNDGESIYHAAQYDRRNCLELLLAHGANVSGRHAGWGNTPLFFLLGHREGQPGTPAADAGIRWLLEHGADPEVTSTAHQETALHCAARVGRGEAMLKLLLDHGANLARRRADGSTPYGLAMRHGNAATAAALAAAGADTSQVTSRDRFLAACFAADATTARELLARDPQLMSAPEPEAREQVTTAAARGDAEALRLMLDLGFPFEPVGPGDATLLHWSAWHGRPACVRLLLERGAPVNVREAEFGCSPLAWACHGSANCRDADADYLAVVDLLLDAGADRDTAVNRWGLGPERMGRPAITARLRERGIAPPEDADDDA